MKKFKKIIIMLVVLITLTGCSELTMYFKNMEQGFKGLDATLRSFDANGDMIDRIEGRSISLERETKFDTEKKDSSVIRATVGGKEIYHVGSSLIVSEAGLEDILDKVDPQVVVENSNRSVPFINHLTSNYKNNFKPGAKIVMIRSQQGHPIAVYSGDRVSIHNSDLANATRILVDGKLIVAYRVDYTIYDAGLLN